MKIEASVRHLHELITSGQTLLSMETYYAEDVEMQENEETPRAGKAACMSHEQENLKKVKHFSATLLHSAIDSEQGIAFSEWEFAIVTLSGKTTAFREVSVQQWRDGKVVREKFYYR